MSTPMVAIYVRPTSPGYSPNPWKLVDWFEDPLDPDEIEEARQLAEAPGNDTAIVETEDGGWFPWRTQRIHDLDGEITTFFTDTRE